MGSYGPWSLQSKCTSYCWETEQPKQRVTEQPCWMLSVSSDGFVTLLCAMAGVKGQWELGWQCGREKGRWTSNAEIAQRCEGKQNLQIPHLPSPNYKIFYHSLYSGFISNKYWNIIPSSQALPANLAEILQLEPRPWAGGRGKLSLFPLANQTRIRGAMCQWMSLLFFPESSFSVRISSLAECPCMNRKEAGWSLHEKQQEEDPNAGLPQPPRTSPPGSCLGLPSAGFPNWAGAGLGLEANVWVSNTLSFCRAGVLCAASAREVAARQAECLCAARTRVLSAELLMELAFGCVLLPRCTSKWSNTSSLIFKAKGCVLVVFIYI